MHVQSCCFANLNQLLFDVLVASPQWHLKLPIDDDIDDDGDNDGVVEGDDNDGDDVDDYGDDDDGDDGGDDDGDRVIVKVIEIAQPCSS